MKNRNCARFMLVLITAALFGACGGTSADDCTVKCDDVKTDCDSKCDNDDCKTKCTTDFNSCTASCRNVTTTTTTTTTNK